MTDEKHYSCKSMTTILGKKSQQNEEETENKEEKDDKKKIGSLKTIDDYNSFYRFIIEMSPRFRDSDLKLVVTINNNNIERNRIEKQVDCIIEE